jgi:rhamnulokinase
MYRDPRTDGIMQRAFAEAPETEIYEATGLQFMQFNTLFQLLALREQKSPALAAADTLLFMPDLFHYLFCGKRASELSIASTSQMYDPRKKAWATDLLEKFGLPTKILAPIVPAGTILGKVLPDVAAECGLTIDVPVITPGAHDTASAVAAVPAVEGSKWCYISSGTWSLLGVELDQPIINEKSRAYGYTNEVGVSGKIRFLKNIMGLWLVQELRRQWRAQGYDHSYAELTDMASRSAPFQVVLDPNHHAFMSPGDIIGKIDRFCEKTGQRTPNTRGEYVRSCLESLALFYRHSIAGIEDVTGQKYDVIHVVGGGSQNELLDQFSADACGRTVVAGPVEGTSIGNILVQAMAVGSVKSLADARAIIRESFPVKPFEPTSTGKWDPAYDRFREVLGK